MWIFETTFLCVLLILVTMVYWSSKCDNLIQSSTFEQALKEKSLSNYEKALQLLQSNHLHLYPKALDLKLECLFKLSKFTNLTKLAHLVEGSNPSHSQINWIAGAFFYIKEYEKACRLYSKIKWEHVDDINRLHIPLYLQALIYLKQQQQALSIANTLVNTYKHEISLVLARLYYEQSEFAVCTENFQDAQTTLTESDYEKWAYSLYRCARYEEAAEKFRHILRFHPTNSWAILGLGQCFETQSLFSKAIQIYSHWLEKNNNSCEKVLYQLGMCFFRLQNWQKSEFFMSKAFEKGLKTPTLFTFLGFACEKNLNFSKAIQIYLKFSETHPDHIGSHSSLAYLFAMNKTGDQKNIDGVFYAQKAVEIMPCDQTWQLLSACLAKQGQYDQALNIATSHLPENSCEENLSIYQKSIEHFKAHQPLDDSLIRRVNVA